MNDQGWSATLQHIVRTAGNWLFRRRSPWMTMIRVGAVFLVPTGLVLSFNMPVENGTFSFTWDTSGGTPVLVTYGIFFVAVLLIVVGIFMEVRSAQAAQAALDRKRVFVIEQRGLRDTTDTPLVDAVPESLPGWRDTILVDLRQGVEDGRIVKPEVALDKVTILPRDLEQRRAAIDRTDTSVVYGGLVPVPYAFLTGLLLDDESAITVMDWDRDAERWRELNGTDDGDRFLVSGLDDITDDVPNVIVAVSVSYKINLPAVRSTIGDWPLVHLDLPNGSTNCHWSEQKQRALTQEFRNAMEILSNRRVGRLHFFIAAQNSVVFRLGRTYDKRNLPLALVYQYERSSTPPYPWAIAMPTHGVERASVTYMVSADLAR